MGPKSGSARACCWPATSPPPIRRQRIQPSMRQRGRGMDQLALHEPPGLGHSPVVHRQPVAGPQGEAQQIEPAGLVDRAAAPPGLDFHQAPPKSAGKATWARRCGCMPVAAASRLTRPSGFSVPSGPKVPSIAARHSCQSPRRRSLRPRPPTRGRPRRSAWPSGRRTAAASFAALDLAAPQVQRADLREPGVQIDGDGFRLAFLPRPQHGADRRQRRHLLAVERHQFARPIGQPRAGDIQRELDRLGDQQIEAPLAAGRCRAPARRRPAPGKTEAKDGMRRGGSSLLLRPPPAFCPPLPRRCNSVRARPAAIRTPWPRRTMP